MLVLSDKIGVLNALWKTGFCKVDPPLPRGIIVIVPHEGTHLMERFMTALFVSDITVVI